MNSRHNKAYLVFLQGKTIVVMTTTKNYKGTIHSNFVKFPILSERSSCTEVLLQILQNYLKTTFYRTLLTLDRMVFVV